MADKPLNKDLKDEYLGALLILADSNDFIVYQKILDQQIEIRKKALADLIVYDQKTMSEQNVLHGEILGLTTAKLIPSHAKAKVDTQREMDLMMDQPIGNLFQDSDPEFGIFKKKDED